MEQQSQFRYSMSSHSQIHTHGLREPYIPHGIAPPLAHDPGLVTGWGRGCRGRRCRGRGCRGRGCHLPQVLLEPFWCNVELPSSLLQLSKTHRRTDRQTDKCMIRINLWQTLQEPFGPVLSFVFFFLSGCSPYVHSSPPWPASWPYAPPDASYACSCPVNDM